MNQDHRNYIIVQISQNTERSPGDRKGFAITQIPAKDHQLLLLRKTRKVI